MNKTLSFGKIDYNNSGRKNCAVIIDVRLKESEKGMTLSFMGRIWNPMMTGCYSRGQNIDKIAKHFPNNAKVQRVKEIWGKYHLNDMRTGTPKQEQALEGRHDGYDKNCVYLESIGPVSYTHLTLPTNREV